MHSSPFLVDCVINDSTLVKSLIDTGCLCFSVFDKYFVRQNNLKTIKIKPIPLRLASGNLTDVITEVTCVKLTIKYYSHTVYGYVVPKLAYSIILGKPWMESNNVTYMAKKRRLRIGSRRHGTLIEENSPSDQFHGKSLLGAASTDDIMKALQKNSPIPREEISKSLPREIQIYTDLFLEDEVSSEPALPPHRRGIDTKITLLKEINGKDKEIPCGRLYGMSRSELLALLK